MSEEKVTNGEAKSFNPHEWLQEQLKNPKLRILRVEANDAQFLALEEAIQTGMQSKAHAHMLVASAPVFEWWQITGMWPRYPEGWTVLIRRARMGVQPQQVPVAPPPKLAP